MILPLLTDAYQRRDRVGMMFQKTAPRSCCRTNSVELRRCSPAPVGQTLAAGLWLLQSSVIMTPAGDGATPGDPDDGAGNVSEAIRPQVEIVMRTDSDEMVLTPIPNRST